jgi:primosomal protein N' (replication factor Y)
MIKGGLRLKRELAVNAPEKPVGEIVVANVWVDASVYHLDGEFSYLIPGNLSRNISIGSLVSIPFHGREVIGVVLSLSELGNLSGLKSISKAIGSAPLLSEPVISLIRAAAARYACHPFDLIRSAIPDRVAGVERDFVERVLPSENVNQSDPLRIYLQLPPSAPRSTLMAKKLSELLKDGPAIALVPDVRELRALSNELSLAEIDHVEIGSHLSKSENFLNFLKARYGDTALVIGTRSAVFTPLHGLKTVFIFNEGSEHFYERRSPGWNVRDIGLIRSQLERVNVVFGGYSPSVEVARLIDEDWISYKRTRAKASIQTISSVNCELLPSRALATIKRALDSGPVLFLVPLKGYAQAIRCQKCRTISRCTCGGAHEKTGAQSPISCNHCQEKVHNWRCIWCHSEVPSLLSRGIERHHLEIGKLFPGKKVQISSSEHLITELVSEGIVISTPGSAPSTESGYSSVVILEGNRFLNQPDMRSSERIREMYFSHAALVRTGGSVLLIQDEGDQIATALATWNPSIALQRDLEERRNLSLPPYVRTAHFTLETSEATRFKSALSKAQEEGRLPQSTRILGPIPTGEKSALILTVDIGDGETLLSTLHVFMRRRSATKKSLPVLRIDPYSLSR